MAPMPGDGVTRMLMTADAVGGVWTYALDLSSALGRHGIAVTLAVMGPAPRDEQRQQALTRGIELVERPYRLEWMPEPWRDVERAGEWLLGLADRCGAEIVHLNGYAHAALPWSLPVVVVAHSCVRTWWRGVHGDDAPREWDLYTARVAAGLRRAAHIVAPTRALLAMLQREYAVHPSCSVIPNGSSSAIVTTPRDKEPMVFAAGRLWDEAKNLQALCAVAPQIAWPVYLAGEVEGPSGCFVPSGAVRTLGPVSAEAMQEWYARAAIYALPARYEPFGLSIVEAAANRCALVLGDIPTLRENWQGAALFVPPDNRRALLGAIERLMQDPALRRALGDRAQASAQRFSVTAMADAYVTLYNQLLTPAAAA